MTVLLKGAIHPGGVTTDHPLERELLECDGRPALLHGGALAAVEG
jgi:hypothetical protein